MALPKVGDKIYVQTSLYLSHGEDDFCGGWAIVSKVYEQYGSVWISIEERVSHGYNWEYLEKQQEEWTKEYGDQHAHEDPDDRPEFNRWD